MSDEDWQCGDCGTLIDGPETRRCPNCGGINFYPLADEVPGGAEGAISVDIDVERVLEQLASDDANEE